MIPQHQQGIGLGPVSDSGITSVELEKRNILPADDGKGPHATSASGLPPLGLEAKTD